MYWLATGHTPRDDAANEAHFESHGRIKPPSLHRSDLPVDLERLILRCLARDPYERPLSMGELANELRSCRSFGSWSQEDARRYWRERGNRFAPGRLAPNDIPTLAAT